MLLYMERYFSWLDSSSFLLNDFPWPQTPLAPQEIWFSMLAFGLGFLLAAYTNTLFYPFVHLCNQVCWPQIQIQDTCYVMHCVYVRASRFFLNHTTERELGSGEILFLIASFSKHITSPSKYDIQPGQVIHFYVC